MNKHALHLSTILILVILSACNLPRKNELPLATPVSQGNPVEAARTATAMATDIVPTLAPAVTPVVVTPIPQPTRTLPPLQTSGPVSLKSIRMINATEGWAIGASQPELPEPVLRTSDGGKTWKNVTPPGDPSRAQAAAFFSDAKTAWVAYSTLVPASNVVGDAVVWQTHDGGQTWQASQPLSRPSTLEFFVFSQIEFLNASNGWLLAHLGVGMSHDYVAIFTTSDGGKTWKRVVDPDLNNLPMACQKTGVTFVDVNTGWAAGNCGGVIDGYYLYQTMDGGATWKAVTLPLPGGSPSDQFTKSGTYCWADAPRFLSGSDGFLSISCNMTAESVQKRWLYYTRDAGKTWAAANLPASLGTFEFINPQSGWYLGLASPDSPVGSKIYATVDGGKTWQSISVVNWNGQLNFVDAKNGWIVAKAGDESALVHSSDGGRSWQEIKPQLVQ